MSFVDFLDMVSGLSPKVYTHMHVYKYTHIGIGTYIIYTHMYYRYIAT